MTLFCTECKLPEDKLPVGLNTFTVRNGRLVCLECWKILEANEEMMRQAGKCVEHEWHLIPFTIYLKENKLHTAGIGHYEYICRKCGEREYQLIDRKGKLDA